MKGLISLDLSKFDTSSVSQMKYMFDCDSALVYVNFKSFVEKDAEVSIEGFFPSDRSDLIYCIDKNKSPIINNFLESKGNKNDCNKYQNR